MSDTPDLWLRDLAGNRLAQLVEVTDVEVEDRLGDLSSLKFTLRASDPLLDLVLPDALVDYLGRSWRIRELDQQHNRGTALVTVHADARWLDLARRLKFGNFPLLAKVPQAGLVEILKGTGWAAGADPDAADTTLYSTEGYDDTVLTHLRRWADITGYELEFDDQALTVSLVETVGQDRGVGFRYGHNLAGFRRRYEPPRATVLYPVGANDLGIDDVNPDGEPYIENFGWYVAQGLTIAQARTLHTKQEAWVDDRYLVPLNLYDAAVRRLADLAEPVISYECSVVDLADAAGTSASVDVGDTVRVYDETFGVDIATRVVRRISRPLTPGGDEVELSYLRPTFAYGEEQGNRSPNYAAISVLVDETEAVTVTSGAEDYAVIALNTTGSASTLVVGGTFVGTATGTGTIRFSLIVDAVAVGTNYERTFTSGELVEFSAPSYVADVAEGSHTVAWRAQVVAGAGTISVAAGGARGWVLASGAYGLGINNSPNRRIVEEHLLDELTFSDGFAVVLHDALDIVEGDTVVLDELTFAESYATPFIIGDPLFGQLDGPGTLT